MIGAFMHGQDPLSEIRRMLIQGQDSMFFVAADGTLTFLPSGHRAFLAPYLTVQATFDDDGTDLPYTDLNLDYSEAFLTNEWNVTRTEGLTQTASSASSITSYGKRSQSLTDVPVDDDADALDIATVNLAKYSLPLTRITSLEVDTSDPAVTEAVFRLDLGDRIRVFRTPPGGGTRIDQTLFVQKIDVDAGPQPPWRIKLGVSPV